MSCWPLLHVALIGLFYYCHVIVGNKLLIGEQRGFNDNRRRLRDQYRGRPREALLPMPTPAALVALSGDTSRLKQMGIKSKHAAAEVGLNG